MSYDPHRYLVVVDEAGCQLREISGIDGVRGTKGFVVMPV